jgi:MerR family redox-sensitive transcriptional activator SoxR
VAVAAPDSTEARTVSIGELARLASVEASTIRYYERRGLLPIPERTSGRRRYRPDVLNLLRVIKVCKEAGFTLQEVEQLLHGFDPSTPPSERWRDLAEGKLRQIDALIARAEAMRALLTRGLECGCLTLEDCSFVEDQVRPA